MASRSNSLPWADPTFHTAWRRLERQQVQALVIVHHIGPRYWSHDGWTKKLHLAVLYADEDTAWLIAECYQDGEVNVERLCDLPGGIDD